MKTVLIVEDSKDLQRFYARLDGPNLTVHQAYSIAEAAELFKQHLGQLDAIFIDGCVPGHRLNTLPLIGAIRLAGYTGRLFATSSDPFNWMAMVEAGCTEGLKKEQVLRYLIALSRDQDVAQP